MNLLENPRKRRRARRRRLTAKQIAAGFGGKSRRRRRHNPSPAPARRRRRSARRSSSRRRGRRHNPFAPAVGGMLGTVKQAATFMAGDWLGDFLATVLRSRIAPLQRFRAGYVQAGVGLLGAMLLRRTRWRGMAPLFAIANVANGLKFSLPIPTGGGFATRKGLADFVTDDDGMSDFVTDADDMAGNDVLLGAAPPAGLLGDADETGLPAYA